MRKLIVNCSLMLIVLTLAACGGLRFSQVSPEATDFHPGKIAVFPVDAGSYGEAKVPVEQIVAGVLTDKQWFTDIVDAESLNRQLLSNEELRKAMTDYLSKLHTVNFSDQNLSKKIGELIKVDAFLLVSVDMWKYAVEKGEDVAKVSLNMKLYEAETGKIMWKAAHQVTDKYVLIKPELSKVARNLVKDMLGYMPH